MHKREFEKTSEVQASSCKRTKKCAMKMKKKKETKNDCRLKIFYGERKDFIRLYQKNGGTDVDELWVIDSSNSEGTNSLLNGQIRWFIVHNCTTGNIKLAMAGT